MKKGLNDSFPGTKLAHMKAHAFLAIVLLGGLSTVAFAGTEDDAFDAEVKLYVGQVKEARPLEDPKNAEFYKEFTAMKADFQANNAWLFENSNWPVILQRRVERELRMRRVRNAGKLPTSRSNRFRPSKNNLKGATDLDADLDLDSIYDRKDGKRRFIRRVDDKKK